MSMQTSDVRQAEDASSAFMNDLASKHSQATSQAWAGCVHPARERGRTHYACRFVLLSALAISCAGSMGMSPRLSCWCWCCCLLFADCGSSCTITAIAERHADACMLHLRLQCTDPFLILTAMC